ncbi:MAG: BACON domain-containing protein [Bacteroidaceae bacterium]|nr:BACON domain-containing protein [Bacteroidaceae bacterium]MBR4040946.1 BACON domain-containing protein [Bacteroidaceae bacterium]
MKSLQLRIGLFVMGLCSLLLVACNEDTPLGGGGEVLPNDTVSISPNDSLAFTGASSTDTVVVHCNDTWNIYGYAYWASVSPQSGKDGDTLIVSVDANTTGDVRKVSYYLYSGEAKCELVVSQQGAAVPTIPVIEEVKYFYDSFDYGHIAFVKPRLELVVKTKNMTSLQIWDSRIDNMIVWNSRNYNSYECVGEETYRLILTDLQWAEVLKMRACNELGKSDFSETIYIKDYIEDPAVKALIDKEIESLMGYIPGL